MALDTLDFWVATFAIYLLATFQTILFGWVFGVEKGMEELHRGAEIRIPGIFKPIIKYVTPLYLLAVFGLWLYKNFFALPKGETGRIQQVVSNPVVGGMVLFILAVAVLFAFLIAQSVRNWRRAEVAREEVAI